MPQWLIYLRIALTVIMIIRQLKAEKQVDAAKVLSAIEPALPEKFKGNLSLLTPNDIKGIQEAFLTLGALVAEPKPVDVNKINLN